MPLVYQQHINAVTQLAVWHIAENEHFFLNRVTVNKEITHPHKRLQHLAGRYLLLELFPDFPLELIKIADTKKPYLPNERYHFSISHCGDYAAVIVSSVNRVGVDIEIISEKARRIKDKFLSTEEQQLLVQVGTPQSVTAALSMFTLAWSIKETMFKWYGAGGIDFKKHLHIDQVKQDSNEYIARCNFIKNEAVPMTVHGLSFNANVLTWTVTA